MCGPVLSTVGEKRKQTLGLYQPYRGEYEKTSLRFIPYFGFANRGVSEMLVWVAVK